MTGLVNFEHALREQGFEKTLSARETAAWNLKSLTVFERPYFKKTILTTCNLSGLLPAIIHCTTCFVLTNVSGWAHSCTCICMEEN